MRSGLWRVWAVVTGVVVCCAPFARAESEETAPHEMTFASAFGSFTVGSRFATIDRHISANLVHPTREALLSGVAYGRINGPATGVLKTGYHVACAIDIDGGIANVTPDITLSGPPGPDGLPQIQAQMRPTLDLKVNPGEVKEIPLGEKEMAPGHTVQIVVRDFRLSVNDCTGPVSVRQYTYVYARSADVDDSGAVFGDEMWVL
ncbi:MspA family porin [Nocardia sp. NPDC004068]|uniref:MspA family porin n=1 Tax=Nocardia sp. NPDC004068 TaxID=3364303 RepID=UPI0036AA076B